VLREQPNCLAIDLTPSPLRALTRISTACSWVNIDGPGKAAILSQVGQFYFDGVGQYYPGANMCASHEKAVSDHMDECAHYSPCYRFPLVFAGELSLPINCSFHIVYKRLGILFEVNIKIV